MTESRQIALLLGSDHPGRARDIEVRRRRTSSLDLLYISVKTVEKHRNNEKSDTQ